MNWKGQAIHLLVHWGFPALLAIVSLLAWSSDLPLRALRRWGWRRLALASLALKVAYLIVLYVALGHRGASDFDYYSSMSRRVLAGEVPGRDFTNFYGPLFPYVLAGGMKVLPGGGGAGILLGFLLGDAVAGAAGFLLALGLLGEREGSRVGAFLYLTPLLWHLAVVWGQDEALFLAFLSVGLLLIHRGRPAAAGAVLGLGLCCTKALFAPYALGALLPSLTGPRRNSAPIWFAGVAGAVHAVAILAGWDPFSIVRYPGEQLPFVCYNLYDLEKWVMGPDARLLGRILYAAVVASAAGACALWSRGMPDAWRAVYGVALVHSLSMLVQPFCLEVYLAQGLLPVLLVLLAGGAGGPWKFALPGLAVVALSVAVMCKVPEGVIWIGVVPPFLALHGMIVVKIARDLLRHRRGGCEIARPESASCDVA